MPARRATASGLASEQLAHLADDVAAGRRPRVRVSGSQFPDGTSGTVVRVGDPAVDGDDFVLVRVKVHGVTDELRFSPRELSVGRRPPLAEPPPPTAPAHRRSAPAKRAVRATPPPAPTPPPAAKAARPAPPARSAPTRPTRSTPRRTGPAPAVTITITSSGSSWSVAARRGAKTVVKKADVTPGAVAAIAALLADRAVEDAVAGVNDSARAEAEARAEQLRAELAAVEAVLVSHERPGRR